MNKKEVRTILRSNPEFTVWIKSKQERVKQIKQDPNTVIELMETWKKTQSRKENLKKIAGTYNSMKEHVQELNNLMQKVDLLVANVKDMAQMVEGLNLEKIQAASSIVAEKKASKSKK